MPRIFPLNIKTAPAEITISFNQHKLEYNGRITNMKATLGHSFTSFKAYMQWYPLYEDVKKVLGPRLASLFAWSVSEASDCPLCSTYFRKVIIEAGEDPQQLVLSQEDNALLTYGAAIAEHKGFVSDEVYEPIAARFKDREIVLLTAFAGIMIATNIFNNVMRTDIDEYLHPFQPEKVTDGHDRR